MKLVRNAILLVAAGVLAAPALAAEVELGMDAPALKISEWVKGKAVDLKDGKGKNVYVVEFWATWCGPCKRSIPHLTEMQKKFADKNVVFIGITDEVDSVDKVREFVKGQGDKMDYVVAIDTKAEKSKDAEKGKDAKDGKEKAEKDGKTEVAADADEATATSAAYMKAFKIDGIPCAFIVDKAGKVAYVGNPLDPDDKFDESLEKIVDGKWDLAAANKKYHEQRAGQEKQEKLATAANTYFQTVIEGGDAAKAKKAAEEFMKAADKDGQALNQFAWILLTNPRIKNRDLELATRMSKAAYDATEGKDAAIIDTYAKALFDSGKVADALKYQKKAVELCAEMKGEQVEQMCTELKETLKKYEDAQKKE